MSNIYYVRIVHRWNSLAVADNERFPRENKEQGPGYDILPARLYSKTPGPKCSRPERDSGRDRGKLIRSERPLGESVRERTPAPRDSG